MKASELCAEIHRLLDPLPTFIEPSEVPFNNGLYFFYEKGEVSAHSPESRIVRVGNHPRSQDGLKRRLRLHYSGNKNSSVFRKFIGGAILRKTNPNHPCLSPGPGKGHWEKQDMPACQKCKPIETEVSNLLKSNFWFRCVEIRDKSLRNDLEEKLIASISLCPECKPSNNWLGKFAYSDNVRNSGLWNSDYVFDQSLKLNTTELKKLEKLINSTLNLFEQNIGI
jgi:hypothetical protein